MKLVQLILALTLACAVAAFSATTGCDASARASDSADCDAEEEISLRVAHLAHQELLRRLPEGYVCVIKGFDEAPNRLGLQPALHQAGVCVWIITPDTGLPEVLVRLQLEPLERVVEEPLFEVESFAVILVWQADSEEARDLLRQLRR